MGIDPIFLAQAQPNASGNRSNAPRHGWRRKRSGGRPLRPLGSPGRATAPQRAPLRGKPLVTCPRPRRRSLPQLGVACIGSVSDVRRRPMACTGALCPTRAGRPRTVLSACPRELGKLGRAARARPGRGYWPAPRALTRCSDRRLGVLLVHACLRVPHSGVGQGGRPFLRWTRPLGLGWAGTGILDTQERRHHTSARCGAVAQLGER